jgi:glycyl-tRNA synthetase beta subunit
MINADGGKKVIAGNSRVVRARLSDGEFYWDQDKKTNLADWGKKLADVVFHAKVGMMDAKVARIEKLAVAIVDALCHAEQREASPATGEILRYAQDDKHLVRRAAQLCKADLTSGMVGEFPELQGIMGRYYATAQGESADVAEAIYEHYKPQGAGDDLPKTELGAIIAIADKLDSIVSLFAAGEKPTGSKDPLALRRAALGVLRIIVEFKFSFDFRSILIEAMESLKAKEVNTRNEIFFFFVDRIRVYFKETYKISHECSEAIISRYIDYIDEIVNNLYIDYELIQVNIDIYRPRILYNNLFFDTLKNLYLINNNIITFNTYYTNYYNILFISIYIEPDLYNDDIIEDILLNDNFFQLYFSIYSWRDSLINNYNKIEEK